MFGEDVPAIRVVVGEILERERAVDVKYPLRYVSRHVIESVVVWPV